MLEAVGMLFLAEDMQGLTQELRTLYVELVTAAVVYNILGDRLYRWGGTDGGQARGVRASKFDGFKAPNLLALIANADVRAWFRETFPIAYAESSEDIYTQNDVENCARSVPCPSLARPSPDLNFTRLDST